MKSRKWFLVVLCIFCFSLICHPVLGESSKTVLLVYMTGSDLESSNGAASRDIAEIVHALPDTSDIQTLIMTGGAGKWHNEVDPAESAIYSVENGSLTKLHSEPMKNMGESDTLRDFLSWSVAEKPADHYALILWDHGGGPLTGVCFDEQFTLESESADALSLDELTAALSSSPFVREKLLFIGFDACLMASYEVACAVAPFADYMIASQETEPVSGWDYSFLQHVPSSASGTDWADCILTSYKASLQDSLEPVTLSCLDLSLLPALTEKLDAFFLSMSDEMTPEKYVAIADGRVNSKTLGLSTTSSFDLVDLVDLLSVYQEDSAFPASSLLDVLNQIIVSRTGINDEFTNGLSIYFPFDNKSRYISSWASRYAGISSEGYRSFIRAFSDIYLGESLMDWQSDYQTEMQEEEGSALLTMRLSEQDMNSIARSRMIVLEQLQQDYYQLVYYQDHVDSYGDVLSARYRGEALYQIDGSGAILKGPFSYFPAGDGIALHGIVHYIIDWDIPFSEQKLMDTVRLLFLPDSEGIYHFSCFMSSAPSEDGLYLPADIDLSACEEIEILPFGPSMNDGGITSLTFYPYMDSQFLNPSETLQFAFLPVQTMNNRFAYLRLTDYQGETVCSDVVSVPNPSMIAIADPSVFPVADHFSLDLMSAELTTGYSAGIKLVFCMRNNSASVASIQTGSPEINHHTAESRIWESAGEINPAASAEITVIIPAASIQELNIAEIEQISLPIEIIPSGADPVAANIEIPVHVNTSFMLPQ